MDSPISWGILAILGIYIFIKFVAASSEKTFPKKKGKWNYTKYFQDVCPKSRTQTYNV